MKNTLWTFGDSLTDGFRSTDTWAKEYNEWKGYVSKTYGEIISDKLKMNLVNLGKGGSDNNTIFETFCKNIKNIKKDDIVIIGWSSVVRFRLAENESRWKMFVPAYGGDDQKKKWMDKQIKDINNISIKTIDEILVNRMSHLYINEINILINFLEYIVKDFKIINWSAYENGKINTNYAAFCERITTETKEEIQDGHFSEKGHLQLSEFLIDILNNNQKLL